MSPLWLIPTFGLGALAGIFVAALCHIAADSDRCRTCLDAAKADSWSQAVLGLEFLGFTVVSPSLIVDLARVALICTPEEAPASA